MQAQPQEEEVTDAGNWARLAAEVRRRREKMRLPIDLVNVGGPTEMTVRKIESGEPASIRPKTKVRLERALRWRDGLVDRILDGTVTDEELAEVEVRECKWCSCHEHAPT